MTWRNRIVGRRQVKPETLTANPRNWRTHPKAQAEALEGLLDDVGWVQDVIVNKRTGRLVDGHLRVERAVARGEAKIPVLFVDLDENEEALVLAALDPLAAMAGTDAEKLAELLGDAQTNSDALADALRVVSVAGHTRTLPPRDAPPEQVYTMPAKPETRPGDIYTCGDHVLICGDCRDPQVIARVLEPGAADAVVTDPPYAIYGSSTGLASSVADDRMVRDFFGGILHSSAELVRWFGHVYVFCDWRSWSAWWESARGRALTPKNMIVWDKGAGGLGSMWRNCHELVAFFVKEPTKSVMKQQAPSGHRMVMRSNVVHYARTSGEDRHHNAAKPPSLIRELVEASCDEGATVVDLFLGSGTTLVACEVSGRKCVGVEIEPSWCDVIVARWEALTGKKAERVRA